MRANERPDDAQAPDIIPSIGELCVVLGLLLVLTATTTALAFVPMPAVGHVATAMGIAAIKAGLIAAFFMHLAREERLIRMAAVAGALWLAILFLFVLVDVALRA